MSPIKPFYKEFPLSASNQRYQKVLESIPCYPDSISSIEIRDLLKYSAFISTHIDEKSQLRSIQREITKVLIDHSSIEVIDTERPFRYQIAKGHKHPIKPDGMSSVVSLQVIEKEIKSMLPPTLRSGIDAIFSSLKQEDTKQTKLWNKRFCYFQSEFPLIAPQVGNEFFSLIEEALLHKKDINFTYQKRGAKRPKPYTATPLGLFLYGNSFYLVAMNCGCTDDIRVYALHRISSIKIGFTSTNTLEEFNVRQYIEEHARHFSGGEMQTVVLRIENDRGVHLLEESRLSINQTIISQDSTYTTIKAEVRDSYTFEWWLMKNANIVEILEPIQTRNNVIKMLKESMVLYS